MNTNDYGPGSLRQAIFDVNNVSGTTPGVDEIDFDIPGNGPFTIQPGLSLGEPLPRILNYVTIDATTQPGYTPGHPMIELDGTYAIRQDGTGSGLEFDVSTPDASTVSGLVINRFIQEGILVDPLDQAPVQIKNNFIGTDVTGSIALANGDDGILVDTNQSSVSITNNVISGNLNQGVELYSSGSYIDQNLIGTDATGTYAIGNGTNGVDIGAGSAGNQITSNVISGNGGDGVVVFGPTGQDLIQGNYIGTDVTGTASVGNGQAGLAIINSPNNIIGGTSAGAQNVVSGNVGDGISVGGPGSTGNLVQGNFVGINADGTAPIGNGSQPNSADYGIRVGLGGASFNTVSGNVVSGNLRGGLSIDNLAFDNLVVDNRIGTDPSGKLAIGNVDGGMIIQSDAHNNVVQNNLISGNLGPGLNIAGSPGAVNNLVEGNYIGTDVTGTAALGNQGDGVDVYLSLNTIGGTTPGSANVISGNAFNGISLGGSEATGIAVEGNLIGTSIDGTSQLGNGGNGIEVFGGASADTIGGSSSGAGNVVSGNTLDGISIHDPGTEGILVQGNLIGTSVDGTSRLGNGNNGVEVSSGASSNTIGGTTGGAGNIIAFNGSNGVTVGLDVLDAALENAILENSIFTNSGLGIDVDNTAPQAAPVLTGAINNGSQTTITGTVTGAPNASFRIEFFSNPAGTSQGKTYLGFLDVMTNGSGAASFSFAPASTVAPGLNITATTTDPDGNTSEFSAAATVQSNVTSDLSVKFGGFIYNRKTRQFSQTLTITNISGAAIMGPIDLVLLNLNNATLVNQTGVTQGNTFITVLSSGSLGVGQSLTVTLIFADPTLGPITYTPEFLSGPFQ